MLRKTLSVGLGAGITSAAFLSAQAPTGLWWLAPIALVPWLVTLRRGSPLLGGYSGLAIGTITGALSSLWIYGAVVGLGAPPLGAAFGVVLVSLVVTGVPWALMGVAWALTSAAVPLARIALFTAAVFAIEGARSQAPGSIPWLLLGHSQAAAPGVAQLAVVGGVPLLSALLAGLSAAAALALAPRAPESRRGAALTAAGLAGAYGALLVFGVSAVERARDQGPGEALDLLIVQPDIPAGERWVDRAQRTNLEIVARQTTAALASSPRPPDLILWPETLLTSPIDADDSLRSALLERVAEMRTPLVLGAAQSAVGGHRNLYRNSVLWVDPQEGVVAGFDKTRAIPVIESAAVFPGRGVLESLMGLAFDRGRVEEARENRPLRGPVEFAVALCFESVFPNLVAARRTPETFAILNLANDSWFLDPTPSLQQVAFSSFRAIEQRLWLVRVAHGGVSAVVDPYGRVTAALPFGEKATLAARIYRERPAAQVEKLALVGLLAAGGACGLLMSRLLLRRI